jgi:uncharacterized protein (TIGR00255 family)
MTGFGRGGFTIGEESYTVEVRALNHRYLDIKVRMPERFFPLEAKVREVIKKGFSRGTFNIYVSVVSGPAEEALEVNIPLARKYLEAEVKLKKKLGLSGDVDVPLLLRLRDILTSARREEDLEGDWKAFNQGLKTALAQLLEMRQTEGEALKKDILSRLEVIELLLAKIEERVPEVVARHKERLTEEMERLTEQMKPLIGDKVDETRLVTEAAIFAERTDTSEEIVRFKSHIKRMRDYLVLSEPVGRRLDFLCQEMLREASTVASKSNDAGITQTIVEIKGELEKVREQVQNIE